MNTKVIYEWGKPDDFPMTKPTWHVSQVKIELNHDEETKETTYYLTNPTFHGVTSYVTVSGTLPPMYNFNGSLTEAEFIACANAFRAYVGLNPIDI